MPAPFPPARVPTEEASSSALPRRPGSSDGLQKKLQALTEDPSVDLWAMDEVDFQQHGSRCRMWVPPEVRDPILLHAWTHKSVGYWGAVRLRDGKMIYRREPGMFNKVSCTQ